MTNLKTIIRPAKAAPPAGPYNHAVRAGNLLFCSGQIPIDPANPTAPFPRGASVEIEVIALYPA